MFILQGVREKDNQASYCCHKGEQRGAFQAILFLFLIMTILVRLALH